MNLDRLVRHLQTDTSRVGLSKIGEEIGNELPRNRLYLLQKARATLATTKLAEDSDYARGYMMALRDVLAAYEATVEDNMRKCIFDPEDATTGSFKR